MEFFWKCKVNKTIIKEKFDMLPSTASLEKGLSSANQKKKIMKTAALQYWIWPSSVDVRMLERG